jgi:3-hydroxy-9,10-secoandrosta-1,3,5(10)-triene-9,17-dione monooxygenase
MSTTAMQSIPVPEPGLTQDEVVQRARDMIPVLRERQEECERIGRLPDETSRDFVEAGFYRILQPRRFGGYEFDLPTFTRVAIALARGCPASGWTYTLTAGHAHMLAALWSEEGQIDIYGADGEVRMPGRFRPGTATAVDGGYRVSGTWDYVSGCDSATHLAAARAASAGSSSRRRRRSPSARRGACSTSTRRACASARRRCCRSSR